MRAAWLIALAIVALAPRPAAADRAKAEAYFRAGAQAFDAQRFGAAAEDFEAAYHELALPQIAFSAAQAHRRQYYVDGKVEHVQRAIALYRIYLDAVKAGGRVADAADGLAEMKRELEHLPQGAAAPPAPPATRLAISVVVAGQVHASAELEAPASAAVPGAAATLDGKPAELFVPLDVSPGSHVIRVTAPGYQPVTLQRVAVAGASDVVEAPLVPEPAHVAVQVEDGARIAFDGRLAGDAPLAPQELAAGTHVVAITRRGRIPVVRDLTLARGETRVLDVHLAPTAKRRALPYLVGTAGGLAIASGIAAGFAVSADHALAAIEHERETQGITSAQLDQYNHDASRRDVLRDLAWAAGGAAVATGAVAALLYELDVPPQRTIVPAVGPHGVGVTFGGSF